MTAAYDRLKAWALRPAAMGWEALKLLRAGVTTGDLLLAWMSEREGGTWEQFRRAHAWVTRDHDNAGKAWIAARDLQALGHAEFAWQHDLSWNIAPPVLTMLAGGGGLAYLTGARTATLFEWLDEAERDLDCFPEAVAERQAGPSSVFIAFQSTTAASELASFLGVGFTYSVAEAIATVLPDLPSMVAGGSPAEFPLGFPRQVFDTARLEWRPSPEDAQEAPPGLYRVEVWAGMEFRLVDARRRVLKCQPEAGAYEALRFEGRRVLQYDGESLTLRVPATAGLPPLHMRAATLSSGLLPRVEREGATAWLSYDNVAPPVGRAILRTLGQ